jgi:hypothetical protein
VIGFVLLTFTNDFTDDFAGRIVRKWAQARVPMSFEGSDLRVAFQEPTRNETGKDD